MKALNLKSIMAIVAEKISERRAQLNWRQEWVSEEIGKSQTLLSLLENGQYEQVKFSDLVNIANVLSLSLEELFDLGITNNYAYSQVNLPTSSSNVQHNQVEDGYKLALAAKDEVIKLLKEELEKLRSSVRN